MFLYLFIYCVCCCKYYYITAWYIIIKLKYYVFMIENQGVLCSCISRYKKLSETVHIEYRQNNIRVNCVTIKCKIG